MSETICISNQKGGCGKTTLTHNLGCVLATDFNKKVLFVDVDGQSNLTLAFGFDPDEPRLTTAELFTETEVNLKDYVIETPIKNVSLIPASQRTFSAEKILLTRNDQQFVLTDALESIKYDYDFIFMDTPPSLGALTLNALISAKWIILVYTASDFALDGLSQILNTLNSIRSNKRLNINNTEILGAVLNRYRIANKKVNEELTNALSGLTVIPRYFTSISDATEIEKSQFKHQPIGIFNKNHKSSAQFKQFAQEVIKCLID